MLHCSAFEILPDHSHVSVFPVNCSTKYWSRVLCEHKQSVVRESVEDKLEGHGEYWIDNNTLFQQKYICPSGYHFIIDEFCMKLVLLDKPNNISDTIKLLEKDYCSSTDIRLYQDYQDVRRSDITQHKIDTLYTVIEILEEFYAEGSEIFIIGVFFVNNGFYVDYDYGYKYHRYYWLPPPNYPTYIPCFTSRVEVDEQFSNISWYRCGDGSIIADVLVCNAKSDCKDSEDERQCPLCYWDISTVPSCSCSIFHYQCEGGGCVHYDHVCDSISDCPDGDDETFCHVMREFPLFSDKIIKLSFISDLCDPPSGNMLMCRSKLQCYNSSHICHYDHSDGIMAYCEDGSHMGWGSMCRHIECRKHYKCQRSYCIPTRKICDDVTDCPVGDDEAGCEAYSCPGHMRCYGVTYCVPPHEICDGISHCPQQEDEKFCQTCPKGCQCKGTAIYCNNVNAPSLHNQWYSPSALILHNSYSVFDKLYSHHLSKLNHISLLDLKWGSFSVNINLTPKSFLSVKFLYLNHQDLHVLSPYCIEGPNILYANLSYNAIKSIHKNALSLMNNIKILTVAYNKLTSLERHFCKDLSLLTHVYLSNNPLKHVAADVFLQNPDLSVVRSDWYIVCCVAFAIKDCQPQHQFMSSCSQLISSWAQVGVIITQGIIVIVGNVGALLIQCINVQFTNPEKYFIVSLILADLLMGIYLLGIVTVHLIYNTVFYKIVSEWTNSITCISLGLVNFVSSEASLMTLSILAVFRYISINKVGGMAFMKSRIRIANASVWVIFQTSGICYAVYLLTHNMGARNNMCILLGIAHQRYVTHLEYALQIVFIIFNMCFLLTIVVSMLCLFYYIRRSYRRVVRSSGQHAKSHNVRLMRTGLKLLLLLVCNVLTWFPFLIVSILLLSGISVHENVLQWVVVLGIPICSCADPILYNLASFKALFSKLKSRICVTTMIQTPQQIRTFSKTINN